MPRCSLTPMAETAWTEPRLDDLARHVERGFEQVDGRFGRLEQDLRDLRVELNDFRTEFRTVMFRIGGAIIVALIGVIGAILATGA
jgi:hypothetical protein